MALSTLHVNYTAGECNIPYTLCIELCCEDKYTYFYLAIPLYNTEGGDCGTFKIRYSENNAHATHVVQISNLQEIH